MAVINISPWSVFEVEDGTADYGNAYSLSSDGQTVTIVDSDNSVRRFLGYRSTCRPGDVLEFDIEAEFISGTMCALVEVGAFGSVENDQSDAPARSLKQLDSTCATGFVPYKLKMTAPHGVASVMKVLFAVGGTLNFEGTAKYRNPKMFINGMQIGMTAQTVPATSLMGSVHNYVTEMLSQSLSFQQAAQLDGSAGFVGTPFLWKVGGFTPAKKIVGDDIISSAVAICCFENGNSYYPQVRFLKSSASGPGLFSATQEGIIGTIEAFYDNGSDHKRGGAIKFYRKTTTGYAFSVIVPDTSGNEDVFGLFVWNDGAVGPSTDNVQKLGGASHRWSTIHAGTGTIQTSDIRAKDNLEAPSEALMRAWGKVNFKVFQMRDAIAEKGEDKARLHVGVIAQEVAEAFASEGLDASLYGFFCYDKWDDMYETETVVDVEEHVDAETGEIVPAQTHNERRLVCSAGDLYAIRYEEALALECAYQRWLGEQRDAKIEALMQRISALENNN